MTNYGLRYLTAQEFRSYCLDANVEVDPFYSDLEMYEKEGVLLPVARVIKPDEYMSKRKKLDEQSETYGQPIPDWEELERLDQMITFPINGNDYSLWHSFDIEFDLKNRFLICPTPENFIPWQNYSANGCVAEHFYHYWQVHQIYAIQKRYPIFSRYHWILDRLDESSRSKIDFLKPVPFEPTVTLDNNIDYYDALSFFIQLYHGERSRTFSAIREIHGIRHLNNEQYVDYKERQKQNAQLVARKYSFATEHLYKFLSILLDLKFRYQREERTKLADDVEQDVIYLSWFVSLLTQQSTDEIGEEVAKINPWHKQYLRHIDKTLEAWDYLQSTFERVLEEYNTEFPNQVLAKGDVDALASFMQKTGLFIIPYSIFETDKALNDPRAFRRMSIYVGMKNMTTGLEELIRAIVKNQSLDQKAISTLDGLMSCFFTDWYSEFQSVRDKKPLTTDAKAFLDNITDVYTDSLLLDKKHGQIIKTFLTAYWARNLTGHYFTISEDDLYQFLFGPIIKSIYFAILYTWHHALRHNWLNQSN